MAADDDNVYFHTGDKIVALELISGKPQWETEPVPVWKGLQGQGLQSWFAPTLVAHDGGVFFAGGEKIHMSYMGWGSDDIGDDTMSALSAKTGKRIWVADHPYSGYNSPEDLFVADGRVWTGVTAKGNADGRYIAHNRRTGATEEEFRPTLKTFWFHHRCYRAKATDKYILCSRTGIEFVDLESGQWTIHHWVRGGCLYGIMPANGFIYSPPHPCACYPEAKLYGFTALAASTPSRVVADPASATDRLDRGPAFSARLNSKASSRCVSDWPTYRHDAARSGASATQVPTALAPQWDVRLGDRLTQPVVADGRLFVASIDDHTVYALDVDSGTTLWSYRAGGRVDSPPTIYRGRVLFGSASGHVVCLRANDGVQAWRFRVAPADRRTVSFEQVESVWPVHGSVLVQDDVATVVAGRSMYLDGGLRLCRLDVESGSLLSETVLDDRDPETGENLQVHVKGLTMPVALPDVLSSDGDHLFMRSQTMDLEGKRLILGPGSGKYDHLFAAFGFTDDSWFHRSYWLFGDGFQGGAGGYAKNGKTRPGGRILVNHDATVFGYGRKQHYYRWTSVMEYQLFAAPLRNEINAKPKPKPRRGKATVTYRWTRDVPIMVRAMALAGDKLLIAGPEDMIDEEATFQTFSEESTQRQLVLQDAALKGNRGAQFLIIHADTGDTLSKVPLDTPPVFDGLVVADGRVFLATVDGRVLALQSGGGSHDLYTRLSDGGHGLRVLRVAGGRVRAAGTTERGVCVNG